MTNCSKCHKCDNECACPKPSIDIARDTENGLVITINYNGITTRFDTAGLIKDGQTDTSLVANAIERVLTFFAEKHTDAITAQELGAILHLADIGDVSTKGVEEGSTLVYKQNSNCPEGCVGSNNVWQPWNALDHIAQSGSYLSVYDEQGVPIALGMPANPSQYYNLSWNGIDKISFQQPRRATTVGANAYALYMDGNTGEIYGVPA